jgi:hypothetical protein
MNIVLSLSPYGQNAATNRLIVHPPADIYEYGEPWWMILTGKNRRTRRKACPSTTLSTTNTTWTDRGANPRFRNERPATNRLNNDTACLCLSYIIIVKAFILCVNLCLGSTLFLKVEKHFIISVIFLLFFFCSWVCIWVQIFPDLPFEAEAYLNNIH